MEPGSPADQHQLAGAQRGGERPDLGRERAVLLQPRHALAHGGEAALERGRGSQRAVELDALARAHELDRDHVRGAVDDLAGLERGPARPSS